MKPSFLPLSVVLAALATGSPALAQIYQYKDANGKTVISDRPPPPGAAKVQTLSSEAPAPAAPPATSPTASANTPAKAATAADRELEFKKRQKEQKEAADKAQKESADQATRKNDCESARRQLQVLESGERVTTRDEKGERVFIEDNQRAAEINRTRKFVTEACK